MAEANEVMFITSDGDMFLFRDLCEVEGIKKYVIKRPRNRLQAIISKINNNPKTQKFFSILGKRDVYFNKKYIINNIPHNGYLLINSYPMTLTSADFWLDIKDNRPDVKLVLLLVDSMGVKGGHMVATRERLKQIKWDIILSYDKNDCEQYGFRYIGLNYYSPQKIEKEIIEYDLYYISIMKAGREKIIRQLNDLCKINHVKYLFQIVTFFRRITYGKCIRKFLPYDVIIKNIEKSNCILEILQDGQKMQTIRYLEAVCYKKKLLTNNDNIVKYPYYNEKFMRVFKTVDDIDWKWVMRREKVDYGEYNFSARKLLDYIY